MSVDNFSLGIRSLSTSAMCEVFRSHTQAAPGLHSNADACVCVCVFFFFFASMVFKMRLVSSDYCYIGPFPDPLGQIKKSLSYMNFFNLFFNCSIMLYSFLLTVA